MAVRPDGRKLVCTDWAPGFGALFDQANPTSVIARLDRATQYPRSVFTRSPGQAGRWQYRGINL